MRRFYIFLMVIVILGCGGPSAQEEYESALHTYLMEEALFEKIRTDPGYADLKRNGGLDRQREILDKSAKKLKEARDKAYR